MENINMVDFASKVCGMDKKVRKMYIVGRTDGGEGVYSLILDDGECLAQHFCSHAGFAMNDLATRRTERLIEWNKRFGKFDILHIGDDEMTLDKLLELNHNNPINKKEETVDN